MLRLAAEGAIEGALAVRATQFRHKSSYGGAKRGAAVLILAPGHPITIWQLGDMGSMSRLAPRRQADVNKCGYRGVAGACSGRRTPAYLLRRVVAGQRTEERRVGYEFVSWC